MQKKDCIEFEQVAERGYGMDVHKESLVVFFLGGIIFATYTISLNGVLLEVSGTSNRALYTGIAGAGNILPAMFPLLGGWIIKQFGFLPYFVLFMVVILFSFYFIHRLHCKK